MNLLFLPVLVFEILYIGYGRVTDFRGINHPHKKKDTKYADKTPSPRGALTGRSEAKGINVVKSTLIC